MKIYDYANRAVEVDTQGKEIDHINVTVLSGDEVVNIYFSDGTKIYKDSSDCRTLSFFDGQYEIDKENVEKWDNFKFGNTGIFTMSYDRMDYFVGNSDDD